MANNRYYEDNPGSLGGDGHAVGAPTFGNAFQGFSGAQGGGSGGSMPLPSKSIPGLHEAVPPNIASQGISQTVLPGYIPPGGMPPTGGGSSPAVPQNLLGALQDFITNPQNLAGLASVIAGLMSGGGNNQNSEEARRMQQITEARMRRVDPLHQAVTQLAASRLPISARQGIEFPAMKSLP